MTPSQKPWFLGSILLFVASACVVEADDDGGANTAGSGASSSGSGSGGSGNATSTGGSSAGEGGSTVSTGGAGGQGGAATTGGGGDGGGESEDVASCDDLCALAPVDSSTAACVAAFITGLGYNTSHVLCDSVATNTEVGCNACYDAIAVTDGHCIAAHVNCFP